MSAKYITTITVVISKGCDNNHLASLVCGCVRVRVASVLYVLMRTQTTYYYYLLLLLYSKHEEKKK